MQVSLPGQPLRGQGSSTVIYNLAFEMSASRFIKVVEDVLSTVRGASSPARLRTTGQ